MDLKEISTAASIRSGSIRALHQLQNLRIPRRLGLTGCGGERLVDDSPQAAYKENGRRFLLVLTISTSLHVIAGKPGWSRGMAESTIISVIWCCDGESACLHEYPIFEMEFKPRFCAFRGIGDAKRVVFRTAFPPRHLLLTFLRDAAR